ncbi:PLD nuclease N-terminal domain-containing protein [Actinotalea sp. K2]|uniref:PLD nuclease N-terminal domain-containing protein n=1 Tax=Actinotalea sp. K2 TaxID=2939438 RepID=UPI002016CD59|nr:PLD nuclease N-terminal domain-containing protein [Actinotalea sp. K2]MCL3863293.1 PLD nuclease N-terminal domain-containing protein [Actinotalea sp. K2]
MRTNFDLSSIPPGILIGVSAVLLVQIALAVAALVDVHRRPAATVVTGNKWVWVLVIVVSSFLGPILYFAVGRKPAHAVDQPGAGRNSSGADIADALYGSDAKLAHR